jgi:hypothetical protein
MKFVVAIALILASGLAPAQRTKDPGLRYPQHATAPKGYKSSSSGVVASQPATTSAASNLAKIDQTGLTVRASRATTRRSAAPALAGSQDKNKPMRFAAKSHPNSTINPKTSSSGRSVKLH